MTVTVCFHGAESTGKSVLAEQLSRELGIPWVPEYGRTYAETHGTDFTMADLLAIAEGQAAATRTALALQPPLLILDTDQLMTAAWADMLFNDVPEALLSFPKSSHYLLFAADTPWIEDGTRLFGSSADRARFARTSAAMLQRAGVPFTSIAGTWTERAAMARAALAQLQSQAGLDLAGNQGCSGLVE